MPTEYPQIFVSWSSPDRAIAEPLFRRLGAQGLNVCEYSEGMKGGEPLQETVVDWIEHSDIALVLYSPETYQREWIVREVDWCVSALYRGKLKRIIPIHLGPQADPPVVPAGLRSMDLNARQLTKEQVTPETFLRGEDALFELTESLGKLCGIKRWQILPAAVFAMTRERADEMLVLSNQQVEGLRFEDYWRKLCRSLGMGRPPKLLDRLKKRYGSTPGELQPFENGQTIAAIVDARLSAVNEARREKGGPPLFVKWVHDDLRSTDLAVRMAAEDLWHDRDSLLIVDSLSTWDPEIRAVINERISDFRRSSLLWLPPYTQQIGALDSALYQALALVGRIHTEVRSVKDPRRAVSVDAMNEWTMTRWVHRVLLSVLDGLQPSGPAIDEMQKTQTGTKGPPVDTSSFWHA